MNNRTANIARTKYISYLRTVSDSISLSFASKFDFNLKRKGNLGNEFKNN